MGVTRFLPVLLLMLAGVGHAKEPATFKQILIDAEVDWTAGTITAQAGAAADIRMPNPNGNWRLRSRTSRSPSGRKAASVTS